MTCLDIWKGVESIFFAANSEASEETGNSGAASAASDATASASTPNSGGADSSDGSLGTEAAADLRADYQERFPELLGIAVRSLGELARRLPACFPLRNPRNLTMESTFPLPGRFFAVTVFYIAYLLDPQERFYELYRHEYETIESEICGSIGTVIDIYR